MLIRRDLRSRILEDCDGGMTTRVAATKYRVGESWLRRLKQRRRVTGETTPRSSRPKSATKALAEHSELLRSLVDKQPGATLEKLRAELPITVSLTTLRRALDALKLSFRKSRPRGGARSSGRPCGTARMASRNDGLDVERFVFLDGTNVTRLRGRGPRGSSTRCRTAIGSRRPSLTARSTASYVRQQLVPKLRAGEVVVIDNLSVHKVVDVRTAIEAVGARLVYSSP